jgi:hypothetical protein
VLDGQLDVFYRESGTLSPGGALVDEESKSARDKSS